MQYTLYNPTNNALMLTQRIIANYMTYQARPLGEGEGHSQKKQELDRLGDKLGVGLI
jgi:hypothetical protein